jgi:outer membrane lipoprotein-sorting protein
MKLLLFILAFPFLLQAGDPKQDYLALLASLAQIKSLSGKVTTVYYHKGAEQGYKTEKGSFCMQEGKACISYAGLITMSNGKHRLTVDENKKVMMLNYATDKELLKEVYGSLPKPNDSLIDKAVTISYADEGQKVLKLVPKDRSQYEKIELETDQETHFLKKIVYYFKPKGSSSPERIVIQYSEVELNGTIDEGRFSTSKFLSISSNSCKPLKPYNGYNIVDYRKQK